MDTEDFPKDYVIPLGMDDGIMQKGQPRREGKPSLENNREQRVQKEARFVGLHCPPRRKGGSGLRPFSVRRERVWKAQRPLPRKQDSEWITLFPR